MARKRVTPHWLTTELFRILEEKGMTHNDLLDQLSFVGYTVSLATLRYWKTGWSSPRVDDIDVIAKVLGYDVELLLKK